MKKTISNLFMGAGAVALLALGSCSKSSDTLPAINGYSSSDSVAAKNLVSYFPFDGNAKDAKASGTAATEVGVTYVTGLRGQAYQGHTGAYATLAPSAAYTGLGSYTMSVWYKIAAQPTASTGPQGLFFVSQSDQSQSPLMILEIENHAKTGSDSLEVHHGFTNLGSAGWQGFTMMSHDTTSFKGWIHLVTTYDGGSSTYVIYTDGVAIGNNSAFGTNTLSTILYQGNTPPASTTGQGNLSWTSAPATTIILGTWPAGLYGVSASLGSNACFIGEMDELRIYNKALSASDVGALYGLGLQKR